MKPPRIVIVGSSGTDMIIKLDRIPRPGETLLGGEFHITGGGKGANQAVSAARAGGNVAFVARLGQEFAGLLEDGGAYVAWHVCERRESLAEDPLVAHDPGVAACLLSVPTRSIGLPAAPVLDADERGEQAVRVGDSGVIVRLEVQR